MYFLKAVFFSILLLFGIWQYVWSSPAVVDELGCYPSPLKTIEFTPIVTLRANIGTEVAALAFRHEANVIQAVYASTGQFSIYRTVSLPYSSKTPTTLDEKLDPGHILWWDVADRIITKHVEVDWVDPYITAFSPAGNTLATVDGRTLAVERMRREEQLDGDLAVRIWNVETGELQKTDGHARPYLVTNHPSLALSTNGSSYYLVYGGERTLASADPKITGVGTHKSESRVHSECLFCDESKPIPQWEGYVVATIDPSSKSIATAEGDGNVFVSQLDTPYTYSPGYFVLRLGRWWYDAAPTPLALTFDPMGRWLAVLRTAALEIRDTRNWLSPYHIYYRLINTKRMVEMPEAESGRLAFSPNGALLAAAGPNGLQLRRSNSLELLWERSNVGVTSVAFSPHACMLAVGTEKGDVELWQWQVRHKWKFGQQ